MKCDENYFWVTSLQILNWDIWMWATFAALNPFLDQWSAGCNTPFRAWLGNEDYVVLSVTIIDHSWENCSSQSSTK